MIRNMDRRPSVLFYIPTLDAGGAERVCLLYVNNLKSVRGNLALQFVRGELLDELSPDVPLLDLSRRCKSRGRKSFRPFTKLQRLIRIELRILELKLLLLLKSPHSPDGRSIGFWRNSRFGTWMIRLKGKAEVHMEWLHLPSRCWFLLKQARRLARFARKSRCDLVVSFLPYTNSIAILAKIIFNRRLKVVVNVHSIKGRLLKELSQYDRTIIGFLVRLLYGRADLIVAVAQCVKKDLVDTYNLPADKIQVINNPIDLERIRTLAAEDVDHPWLSCKNAPTVVAVGRLTRVKGFDLLIKAFAMLPEPMGCRLMIIGQGEDRKLLEQQARNYGLDGRIAFLGFKKNPWKYMRRADCLVLSSRSEALPNVLGEALALKLPLLATDCSLGVREYLEDGRYGAIVPPGDPSLLAEKLEEMLTDHKIRHRFVSRSDERAEHFALDRIVEVFELTIKQVMRT